MVGNAFLHTVRYFMGGDESHMQTTEEERRAVEIRVYEGANTRIIAENLASDG